MASSAGCGRVLGLDLSLTATGIALPDGTIQTLKTRTVGIERVATIARYVILHTAPTDGFLDLVAIEGYSMGTARQTSHAHGLGELGGVVRYELWQRSIPYVDVPPASLKVVATGRGNASKNDVVVAAVKRLGIEPRDDNQADAAWLRVIGMHLLGHPVVDLPQSHLRGFEKIQLPAGMAPKEAA